MGSVFDGEDTIAGILWILVSLGAINWGLVEFVDLDLVMEVTNAVGGSTAATILYGLIAFGGTLTLLDNLGLLDVTDVVDEIKSFGGN